MKRKIVTLICGVLLLSPSISRAQGDAAAITAFLAPYLAAMQGVSEVTGMDINDIKESAQKTIKIANDIIKTYSTSVEMVEMGNTVQNIYVEYLNGVKYLYENSLYFSEQEQRDFIIMLDYAAFGHIATDKTRPKGLNNVAGGVMSNLPKLLNAQKEGGNTTLKEINDLMNDTQKRIRKTLSDTRTVNRYMEGCARQKQYELGMRDANPHKRKIMKKFGL